LLTGQGGEVGLARSAGCVPLLPPPAQVAEGLGLLGPGRGVVVGDGVLFRGGCPIGGPRAGPRPRAPAACARTPAGQAGRRPTAANNGLKTVGRTGAASISRNAPSQRLTSASGTTPAAPLPRGGGGGGGASRSGSGHETPPPQGRPGPAGRPGEGRPGCRRPGRP